jgi:hypothetical protein
MATLDIGGVKVQVGDEFLNMSPEMQQATVEEIAASISPMLPDGRSKRSAREADPTREQKQAAYGEMARGIRDRMGPVAATADTIGRGLARAFPFMDDLAAGLDTVTGVGRGDSYEDNLDRQRAMNQADDTARPVASYGSQIAGALALPTFGATGLKGGAALGAGYGAAYGAGQGDGLEDRVSRAATGAAVGAPLGAVAGGIAARFGTKPPPGPDGGDVVAAAERMGVELPRYAATESKAVQAMAQAGKQSPFGGPAIERAAENFIEGTKSAVERTASKAAGGGPVERSVVGGAARSAIQDAIDKGDEATSAAYSSVRKAVDQTMPVNVSDILTPALTRIQAVRAAAGETSPLGGELARVVELAGRPGVTFDGLQRARSQLGKAIKWDQRNGGMATGDLKQAYGAMTQALETTVQATAKGKPQQALALFKAADNRFARTMATNKEMSTVLRGSDEAVVDKILTLASEKGGANAQRLAMLKREMGEEAFGQVSGLAIQRMGLNQAGEFTGDMFVRNFGRISENGKSLLFGPKGSEVRSAVEDLAQITARMKEVEKYANRSNTGRATVGTAAVGGLMVDPMTTLATVFGAEIAARIVSQPATAKAAARWAKVYETAVTKPTASTAKVLNQQSGRLGAVISSEFALPTAANDLAQGLTGSSRAAADDERAAP